VRLKKRTILKYLFGFFLILSFSCRKAEEKAVIFLSPDNIIISNVKPLDVLSFEVSCHSPDDLKQLIVSSKLKDEFTNTELDTAISGNDFYMKFEYKVPALIESARILIEFTLKNVTSEIVTNARIIDIVVVPKYLKETAGHEIFTKTSGKQNSYNLLEGIPLFSHLSDSAKMHIADTSNSSVLLKRWVSPAGIKFVRFGGFDYANCSNISVKNSYDAGIKVDFVDNLIQGDILLTKIPVTKTTETYVVLKVVNVIDAPGSEWDRIIFNLKK
jgi:hypothetical protein